MSRGPDQAPAGSLPITQSDVDNQDGVVVSRLKTRAKLGKVDVTRAEGAGIARQLANASHEDGYGKFQGKRKGSNLVTREGVEITTNVGTMDRGAAVEIGDDSQGVEVGRVRHSSSRSRSEEGVTVEDTGRPKAQARKAAPKKAARKAAPKKVSKPRAQAKPKIPAGASSKLRIAMKVYSDFPEDWNFFGKTNEKLARIDELGADADLLDALYASESNSMKKALEGQYPKHFQN